MPGAGISPGYKEDRTSIPADVFVLFVYDALFLRHKLAIWETTELFRGREAPACTAREELQGVRVRRPLLPDGRGGSPERSRD
jgi:hypothetical protein